MLIKSVLTLFAITPNSVWRLLLCGARNVKDGFNTLLCLSIDLKCAKYIYLYVYIKNERTNERRTSKQEENCMEKAPHGFVLAHVHGFGHSELFSVLRVCSRSVLAMVKVLLIDTKTSLFYTYTVYM